MACRPVQVDVESCDTYYYTRERHGIDAIARFLGVRFGSKSGIDCGELPACCFARVEDQALQAARAAEVVPGETDLDRHRGYHSYTPLQLARMAMSHRAHVQAAPIAHIDNPQAGERREVPSEVLHTITSGRTTSSSSTLMPGQQGSTAGAPSGLTYGPRQTDREYRHQAEREVEESKVAERHRDIPLSSPFAPREPRIALAIWSRTRLRARTARSCAHRARLLMLGNCRQLGKPTRRRMPANGRER